MKTCLAGLLVLVVAAPALANICAFDPVPAATLPSSREGLRIDPAWIQPYTCARVQ